MLLEPLEPRTLMSVTIDLTAGDLYRADGADLPLDSTIVLLADANNNHGFGDLTNPDTFTPDAGDIVLDRHGINGFLGPDNSDFSSLLLNAEDITGVDLLLVWYDKAYNAGDTGPGAGVHFGTFRTDSIVDSSSTGWFYPAEGSNIALNFNTLAEGGSQPETAGRTSQITSGGAGAAFPVDLTENQFVSFTEGDGTVAKLTFKKAGGTVTFTGTDLVATPITGGIQVTGTNIAVDNIVAHANATSAKLLLTATGGGDKIEINDLLTTGDFKLIGLGAAHVNGDVSIGHAKTVSFGDVDADHDITITDAGAPMTIAMDQAVGVALSSASPIKKLTVSSLTGGGAPSTIVAPWIGAITATEGNLISGMTLSGTGAPSKTLGKVTAKNGTLGGVWSVTGDTGVAMAADAVNWTLAGGGTATLLKVGRMTDSLVNLGNVITMSAGELRGTDIFAGLVAGAVSDLTGGVRNLTQLTAGDFVVGGGIKKLSVPGVSGSPNKAVKDSRIAATRLGTIKLGTIERDNADAIFGLAGRSFKSIKYLSEAGTPVSVSKTSPGATEDDFVIRIV